MPIKTLLLATATVVGIGAGSAWAQSETFEQQPTNVPAQQMYVAPQHQTSIAPPVTGQSAGDQTTGTRVWPKWMNYNFRGG